MEEKYISILLKLIEAQVNFTVSKTIMLQATTPEDIRQARVLFEDLEKQVYSLASCLVSEKKEGV